MISGHSSREFLDLAGLLVLGSALAAVVQTLLPRTWLLAVGGGPTVSLLSLMLMAVVVSVFLLIALAPFTSGVESVLSSERS